MAEKVQVDGGGDFNGAILKNAASEATLERIAEALEAKEKGLKDKVLGIFTKTVENNVEAQKESTSAFDSFTQTANRGTKVSSRLFDTFSEIAGTSLGTTFSLLSSAGTTFLDFLKNSYTSFQETSDIGASFNNDLFKLRLTAADALIPLDEFKEIIKKNSETFSRFGGSVSQGARIFSGVAASVKEDFGNELVGLGFSLNDLNEGAAAYLDTQSRIGKVENRTNKDLAQGTRDYLLELDKITKLTGVSRKAQEEAARKASVDPIIQSMLDNATDMNKALANISLITKVGGEDALQMFKEMAAGNPGEEAKMLMSTIGMSMEDARAMFTGDIGVEGVVERMKEYAKKMQAEGLKAGQSAEAIMSRNPALAKINKLLNAFERLGDPAVVEQEQKNREKVTEFFGVFGNTLNTIYNKTIAGLIDSPVFYELQAKLEELAKVFTDNSDKIVKFFEGMIKGINGALNTFILSLKDPNQNVFSAIGSLFKDLFTEMSNLAGPILKDFIANLFGETPEQKIQREAFAQATPEMRETMLATNPSLGMPDVSGFFGSMVDGLKSLTSFIPDLSNLGWWLGVTGVGGAVGGIGLGVGLSALAKGLSSISVPALAVGAAIGMGAGGLGFAFKGFSSIIDSVGNTLTKIKDFFVGMQDMNPQKLASIGSALKPLSEGVSTLMNAGFMSLVSGDSLNIFAVAMQRFDTIDPNKISAIGPALKALYDGVSVFSQGSLIESVGASIKTMFSNESLSNVTQVVAKLGEMKIDPANIVNITNFLNSFSKLADINVTNVNLSGVSSALEQISNIKDINLESNNIESIEKSLNALANIKTVNFDNLNIDPVYKIIEQLVRIKELNFENVNFDPMYKALESISQISKVNLEGVEIKPFVDSISSISQEINSQELSNSLVSIKNTLETFQIDQSNIENAVSAIGKLKTTMSDGINIDTKGVDDFNKSIKTLIDTLGSLEDQMKKSSTTNVNVNTNENTRRVFPTEIAGNTPEDLQRQLNMKIDELISHIVEMKQNTKDTADSLSDRSNAV